MRKNTHALHGKSKLSVFMNYSCQTRRVFLILCILKISVTLCLPVMQ